MKGPIVLLGSLEGAMGARWQTPRYYRGDRCQDQTSAGLPESLVGVEERVNTVKLDVLCFIVNVDYIGR